MLRCPPQSTASASASTPAPPPCRRLGGGDGILEEAKTAYEEAEEREKATESQSGFLGFGKAKAAKPAKMASAPIRKLPVVGDAIDGKAATAAKRQTGQPVFKKGTTRAALLDETSNNGYTRLDDEEAGLGAAPAPTAAAPQSWLQKFLSQFDTDGDGDFDMDDLKNVLRQLLLTNRLGLLLFWDMAMLTCCFTLFGALMVTVSFTSELSIYSSELWLGWQASTSFAICKMIFSLSSLPFAVFMIPALRTLFSHTMPTGFDKKGNCVPVNVDGLSAYLCWLDFTLRDWGPTKRRLEASLKCEHSQTLALKYKVLQREIAKARLILGEIGNNAIDRNQMARQERKIVHLDKLMDQIVVEVTRLDDRKHDPMYHAIRYSVDPQSIILHDYMMKLGKQAPSAAVR